MASPALKLYRGKEYVASAKYYEDAAAIVAILGQGATVRVNHKVIVWTEGAETQSAAESYDYAAVTMRQRHIDYQNAAYEKQQKDWRDASARIQAASDVR